MLPLFDPRRCTNRVRSSHRSIRCSRSRLCGKLMKGDLLGSLICWRQAGSLARLGANNLLQIRRKFGASLISMLRFLFHRSRDNRAQSRMNRRVQLTSWKGIVVDDLVNNGGYGISPKWTRSSCNLVQNDAKAEKIG